MRDSDPHFSQKALDRVETRGAGWPTSRSAGGGARRESASGESNGHRNQVASTPRGHSRRPIFSIGETRGRIPGYPAAEASISIDTIKEPNAYRRELIFHDRVDLPRVASISRSLPWSSGISTVTGYPPKVSPSAYEMESHEHETHHKTQRKDPPETEKHRSAHTSSPPLPLHRLRGLTSHLNLLDAGRRARDTGRAVYPFRGGIRPTG